MHILWMLVIGLVTGILARLVVPRRAGGVLVTIALGLTGSFLAGFFGRALGFYRETFDSPGILASVFGALLILVAFRLVVAAPSDEARAADPDPARLAGRRRRVRHSGTRRVWLEQP